MSTQNIIEVEKLVKIYPGGIKAVDGIDFTVQRGEFFGFLGPNGAGKSTTMKVLSTLLKKTSGRVVVASYNVDKNPVEVKRAIGFAMQEVGLDDLVTGREFLVMPGLIYGLPRKEAQSRTRELLEMVGLSGNAQQRVGTYSGGMRRRIDLVSAMVHNPSLLFLDEPTTGLDPQSRLSVWKYLQQLNREGVTIFLTTQMMEEADRLCQRIAIIDNGRIVAQGAPDELKSEIGEDVITIHLDSTDDVDSKAQRDRAESMVKERSYVLEVHPEEVGLSIHVRDGGAAVPDLMRLLNDNGIAVASLSLTSPTLDDVFLKYTGHKIREEQGSRSEYEQVTRPWSRLRR
ncbi:MAG: ATP-binding cassette domain-containing protein [Dehalococcoidia bacterium]